MPDRKRVFLMLQKLFNNKENLSNLRSLMVKFLGVLSHHETFHRRFNMNPTFVFAVTDLPAHFLASATSLMRRTTPAQMDEGRRAEIATDERMREKGRMMESKQLQRNPEAWMQ